MSDEAGTTASTSAACCRDFSRREAGTLAQRVALSRSEGAERRAELYGASPCATARRHRRAMLLGTAIDELHRTVAITRS